MSALQLAHGGVRRRVGSRSLAFLWAALAGWVGAACAPSESGPLGGPGRGAGAEAVLPEEDGPLVVFLGDSLTAGFGLPEDAAFPALLAERASQSGQSIRWINAGVSGDTSAGGLSRLGWLLSQNPDLLVVGLGGNDGLRGLSLERLEENLRAIVQRSRERGAEVLLLGQRLPPTLGLEYTRDFAAIYPRLAEELDVPLVPFLLDGVGGVRALNLPDGLHPNENGHRKVADNVWPTLERVLKGL